MLTSTENKFVLFGGDKKYPLLALANTAQGMTLQLDLKTQTCVWMKEHLQKMLR